ncbi:hypothetical protein [Mycobacterium colombiense]|nr:hypothetical protein [Mycobacterium colombiense]
MPPDAEPLDGTWVTSKDGKDYFRPCDAHKKLAMAYGRTSKAGEHLKGGGDGLANWKASMAALGVLMSDSARSEIVNLINEYDGDPYYAGDDGGFKSGKKRLLEAVELACKVAGSDTASSRGTEFHKLGEMVNKGRIPRVVQDHLVDFLEHYKQRVKPIHFLAQEILIINDEIQRAGSIDYLMELPAGITTPDGITHDEPLVVAGDLKTGKWDIDYPGGVSAQLAGYGLGFRYDQATNTRYPLHPRSSDRWAVIVHFPIAERDAEVSFYWVDMHVGLQAAHLNNRLDRMIAHYKSVKGKPIKFELAA